MPDNIPTDELKRINRIAKRWTNYDALWCLLCGLAVFPFFLFTVVSNPLLGIGMMALLIGLSTYFLSRWSAQRFIRRLSQEDRELVIRTAETSSAPPPAFAYLLKACKINAQREYLRPSQQTEGSDTLLRAAVYTDTASQEQLLRPIQTDKT